MGSDVRIQHITIARPIDAAYDFAHRPGNFPKWAAGLSASLHHTENGWIADTPNGAATVHFSDPNAFGVLDHWVTLPGKPEIYIPLRMIANGADTDVALTLFRQPDMTDADFDRDAEMVRRDLETLKRILEETD